MSYYRFCPDGFRATYDFCADDSKASEAAFEVALELSRAVGRLIMVSVYDSGGRLIARMPQVA